MLRFSRIGAILQKDGGLRVVVTEEWRMRFHVQKGERLFLLPEGVIEPVPWEQIPSVIERARAFVAANR